MWMLLLLNIIISACLTIISAHMFNTSTEFNYNWTEAVNFEKTLVYYLTLCIKQWENHTPACRYQLGMCRKCRWQQVWRAAIISIKSNIWACCNTEGPLLFVLGGFGPQILFSSLSYHSQLVLFQDMVVVFSEKAFIHPLYTSHPSPNSRQTKLTTSLWRQGNI